MPQTVPMRAYVTSGDPLVTTRARSAVPARCNLTPRRMASSGLGALQWREGFAQHAPAVGGDLGVGLGEGPRLVRCSAGGRGTSGGNVHGGGWREARRGDGDARLRTSESRTDIAPLPLP